MAEEIAEPETGQVITSDIHYFKYKGNLIGPCNICGRRLLLHYDHVPPAACDNREAVEVITAFAALTGGRDITPKTFIQNGVKYRTICGPCNNIIGLKYDPALIGLARFVSRSLRSSLFLPQKIQIRTRPGALYRSILGHLMAIRTSPKSGVFDDDVRECVLDGSRPVPDKYHFHYWIYPYRQIVHMRDFATVEMFQPASPETLVMGQLLKFYPLAFWVLFNDVISSPPKLGRFNATPPWEEKELTIDLGEIRPPDFPEAPHNFRVTFLNKDAGRTAHAKPRRKRRLL
jgi:hypothetical protein